MKTKPGRKSRVTVPLKEEEEEGVVILTVKNFCLFKGIVSRDFMVCFLVSFDRSYISTHQEQVFLLLKFRFRIEFPQLLS
jgi:hypothetical protein